MSLSNEKWIRLGNNKALKAVNAAANGTVDILKVDASDITQLLGTVQYSGSEVANKNYVSSMLNGLKPKAAVLAATTAVDGNLNLANFTGTIDGQTLVNGGRYLIKDQTDAFDNGIYTWATGGAFTRALDFDSLSPIDEINGAFTAVQLGTLNAGKVFVVSGTVVTIGVSAINFVFWNAVSTLIAGDGIAISGSTISIGLVSAGGLSFDSSSPKKLQVVVDDSTIEKTAVTGALKVKAAGITSTELAADAVGAAKIRLENNTNLRARNAANDGDVNIIKVNASDIPEFAQFPITPSAAPDADYEVANKKYVDDQISGIPAQMIDSQETLTLVAQDITNGYIDLAHIIKANSQIVWPVGGPIQTPTTDYTLSTVSSKTRVTFAGDLAALLEAGDKLVVKYTY